MKRDEIRTGHTYVGKNGRKRLVTSEGGSVYAGQIDTDTINYIDPNAGVTARQKNMTRTSFAAWAVKEHRP